MSGLSASVFLQSYLGIAIGHLPWSNSVLSTAFFKGGLFSNGEIKFIETEIFSYWSGQRVSQSRSGSISSYLTKIIRGWVLSQRTGKAYI